MNPRISVAVGGIVLAAFGLFAGAPQVQPKAISPEAARLNNLGAAYMNQQLFEKALKCFQKADELDPKLTIARLNEGIAYLNLQKIDKAKFALEEAAKQDPKSPYAWYNLGLLAKNTGDAQAAIGDFKRVTEIDPNDADTWYFLGASYVQARQFPQAIDAFQHALKINPLHASGEFGLSRAYQQSGDIDRARENLKKFQYITQNKLGAPVSLAYGEQGKFSRAVESPQAVLKPPPQIKVRFADVTAESGLTSMVGPAEGFVDAAGPGACFLDYDNDGKIDLFLADNGAHGGMSLYHNLGNGKFEDVTKKAGIPANIHATGCTAGDYDNDGWPDLVVSRNDDVLLFHNEKNGTFREVHDEANLFTNSANLGVTFIDYDHDGDLDLVVTRHYDAAGAMDMFRNNGDETFTNVSEAVGLPDAYSTGGISVVGSDYNNDRAVDIVVPDAPSILENPREGKFILRKPWETPGPPGVRGVAVLDFDHDGWMDLAFTPIDWQGMSLWHNNQGKHFDRIAIPAPTWIRGGYGLAAFDYDNDGWVDLVAVGETKDGKGEIRLFRNLGPEGFKDVTADVGLDKIQLKEPRAIITGDYDGDGATDLLITQNHGPAVLLRNEGGNQNHWLRLALKGLNDNKSAIGTKVEVFSGGNRQKFEIYGSNGYLGQNSPYLTVGLGHATQADIVRMLWPTGVVQDEVEVAADREHKFMEIDRRGGSCPTLFVWDGTHYALVADMIGAGALGHWYRPGQRDVPRPVEFIKLDRNIIHQKESPRTLTSCHPEQSEGPVHSPASCMDLSAPREMGKPKKVLSFRFMEPLEEAVYLDQVRLLAIDHPADIDVYPNEYFASNPPYPPFKVVLSRAPRMPVGVWDEHGHNVLPDLLAHRYVGDFSLTQFAGFAKPHSLTLDLGESGKLG